MLAPHSKQLFLNWNVPNRYMPGKDDGTIEHFDPPLHLQSGEEGKLDTIQEDIKELSVPPSPVKSARSQKVPAPEMPARQMSLPELRLKSPDKGLIAKQYTKLAAGTTAPQAVPKLLSRSKTDIQPKVVSPIPKKCPGKDNVQDIRQELQQSLQPQVVDRAEHWMKLAPQADRKVIERVLRMAEKRQKQSMNLSRALQPNAKEAVEKWLSGANEDERQVALRFFNSVAGEKLMGMSMAEQKKRLQQVISTLEKVEKIQSERGKGAGPYADTSKLRVRRSLGEPRGPCNHLRLLSPGTRRDRWMHTTWHHLPEYKTDNIVENKSSHYTQPQAMIPRHFVIHPDWG